jgi:hypothetical protein
MKWPSGAEKVVGAVNMGLACCYTGYRDALIREGNETLFNSVFGKLSDYMSGPVSTGDTARLADQNLIVTEQTAIQFMYNKASPALLDKLQGQATQDFLSLRAGSIFTRLSPLPPMQRGHIRNLNDRIDFGNCMLGYGSC